MSELKDPAFKLFGKTIPVPSHEETPATKSGDSPEEDHSQSPPIKPQNDQQKNGESEEEQVVYDIPEDISESATTSSGPTESPKTDPSDKETTATDAKTLKQEQELNERSNSQEKTIKKPDKILPCPRCNSLDTKFCYYNNYNVNQPRHFCKNCQRYWTAGGTMRNVPVGAGRRKNKHSAAHHYRQITVSEALAGARPDASDPILCRHPFKPNGTVLNFGPDAPLCESMASVLTLADTNIAKRNGFHITEEMKNPGENVEEHSSGSSNLTEEGNRINLSELVIGNYQGFTPPVPCFPGTPWPPYPWNAAQWSPPQPSLCASSFPVPFYPSAYWGCAIPGAWSIPWLGTGSGLPSPSGFPSNSGPNSPLGKHTRDENTLEHCNSEKGSTVKPHNSEKCLWIPKTLRIDDPDEAARSSIWATLGIKNDKAELISGGGMFKAFKSKMEEKNHMPDTAHVLNANPAALSRSRNFHENL